MATIKKVPGSGYDSKGQVSYKRYGDTWVEGTIEDGQFIPTGNTNPVAKTYDKFIARTTGHDATKWSHPGPIPLPPPPEDPPLTEEETAAAINAAVAAGATDTALALANEHFGYEGGDGIVGNPFTPGTAEWLEYELNRFDLTYEEKRALVAEYHGTGTGDDTGTGLVTEAPTAGVDELPNIFGDDFTLQDQTAFGMATGESEDYPPESITAVQNWYLGIGDKPVLDPETHLVTGYITGPESSYAATVNKIDQRRAAGDPNHITGDMGNVHGGGGTGVARSGAQLEQTAVRGSSSQRTAPPVTQPVNKPASGLTQQTRSLSGLRTPVSPMSGGFSDPTKNYLDQMGTFKRLDPKAGIDLKLPGLGFQPSGEARPVTDLGAPGFLSTQAFNRLLPSEHAGRQAAIAFTGIPVQDYNAQQAKSLSHFSNRRLNRLPLATRL